MAPRYVEVPNSAVAVDAWAELACSMFFTLDYIFILSPALGFKTIAWLSYDRRRRIVWCNFAPNLSFRISRYGVNQVSLGDFPRYSERTKTCFKQERPSLVHRYKPYILYITV